jgi:acyl carrier protein
MGLDSVQLIFEFENKFEINISDEEAIQIYTVRDATEIISSRKDVFQEIDAEFLRTRESILEVLKTIFSNDVVMESKISSLLNSSNKGKFKDIEIKAGLKIPLPEFNYADKSGFFSKLKFWKPNYDWNELTVGDFVDSILISNCKEIVNFKNPASKFEVYIGVAGVTCDVMDINPYEIKPNKDFVKDLGID